MDIKIKNALEIWDSYNNLDRNIIRLEKSVKFKIGEDSYLIEINLINKKLIKNFYKNNIKIDINEVK